MMEGSFGGKKIRLLRKQRGFSQLHIQLNSVVIQKTLSKIETGKTYRPQRETLERILAFYEVSFNESQEILKAFGYLPKYPLPSEQEIDAILAQVQPVLDATPVPAYFVDFLPRLHGFNELFIRLSGVDREKITNLKGQALWLAHYDNQMKDDAALDPHMLEDIRQLRRRMAVYIGEPWFDAFIGGCGEPFLTYWRAAGAVIRKEISLGTPFTAKALRQVSFRLPDVLHPLCFFLNEQTLNNDDRLRIIYLTPADVPTTEWVSAQQGLLR